MTKLKLIVAAALLAMLSSVATGVPLPVLNPAIFGQWKFELTVNTAVVNPAIKGDDDEDICVFTGDIEFTDVDITKDGADKIGDPFQGNAQMELVSGDCGDFTATLEGSGAFNDLFFNMSVFPTAGPAKGDPLIIISMDGQWLDDDLMEGDVVGVIAPNPKGQLGFWRATRSASIPTLSPLGILALLAGLGLVGGIALWRRK